MIGMFVSLVFGIILFIVALYVAIIVLAIAADFLPWFVKYMFSATPTNAKIN